FSLKDKVAIVTGGGRGIGKFIATGLAEAGAHLVIGSRKAAKLETTAEKLRELGVKVLLIPCDMEKEADINQLVELTLKEFGRIDILVNNAGVTWGAPTFDYPLDKWDRIMNVNVRGLWILTQKVGNVMKKQGGGKIIMIASIMGLRGADEQSQPAVAYNAAKGAVINLTRDLALKWAPHGIYVNAIAPGFFATDMMKFLEENPTLKQSMLTKVPLNRIGMEDDIKGVATFLAANASDYVTGEIIVVDGGYTAK
ncbi:MAG: gluconate 5-dehydrogenase, partial [Beggiatoa sp. IS2]